MCYYRFILRKVIADCVKNKTDTSLVEETFEKLMAYEVPIPPLSEQIEIVNTINAILVNEQGAKEMTEAVLNQIGVMKKSILARAFFGQMLSKTTKYGLKIRQGNVNSLKYRQGVFGLWG